MNIWTIKSRLLRTATAWLLFLIVAAMALVLAPLLIIGYAIDGAWRGVRTEVSRLGDKEWAELGNDLRAALTGREAV